MEKFDDVIYDNFSVIYSELENIMEIIYEDVQLDPTNEKKLNLLQGLGSVALKVLSSQRDLVEEYGNKDIKEVLLSNIDAKTTSLTIALSQSNNIKTR